jgi:hypothetical protein
VPKQSEEMTLEELAQEMRKRADSLDHLTATADTNSASSRLINKS